MNSRTRSRSPASIGSNQSSRRWTAASASDCRVGDVVLLLVMAQSPPVCANAGIVWVSAPGDYAILNSNHTPDGTWLAVMEPLLVSVVLDPRGPLINKASGPKLVTVPELVTVALLLETV